MNQGGDQQGKFITFEGIDGSGKSTQLKLLRDKLYEQDEHVVTTREPGGTRVGDAVREILLDASYQDMTVETEALLYAASRVQLVQKFIVPSLDAGAHVLCDRFIDSSLAYQTRTHLNRKDVEQVNKFALKTAVPDVTFLIDVRPQTAYTRMGYKKDRIENKGVDFQRSVRAEYLKLAKENPERIILVDGEKNIWDVFHDIWLQVEAIL